MGRVTIRSPVIAAFGAVALAALSCAKETSPAAQRTRVTLRGSGASFPAPLYSRWFNEYSLQHEDVRVNYQATGSGAGIKAFVAGQTDFGASDAAMTDGEIRAIGDNVPMLPVTAGAIVLAYHLESRRSG